MDVFSRLKQFVVQLFQDDQFRHQLGSASSEERVKLLEQLGYNFSQQEWEVGMLQILDARERDEFEDLTDEQLVALAGAGIDDVTIVPLYGVPVDPDPHYPSYPTKPCTSWWNCLPNHPRPPRPQPKYGGPSLDWDTTQ
jgi:predicted ribosomally synthesized peptide with nif11-like leader